MNWSEDEKQHGKMVKIKGFPKDHKVILFRVVLSTQRRDNIATNDRTQDDTQVVNESTAKRICHSERSEESFP